MVKINNMDTTVFQAVKAPTPSALSNTTILATASFVRTLMNSINLVFNNIYDVINTYTISAVKTIPEIIIETVANNIAIGSIVADQVNVLSSLAPSGRLYIRNVLQALLPSGTAGYSIPLITNSSTTTKIQGNFSGINSSGSTIIFPVAFSVGCVPFVFVNVQNSTPNPPMLYQPSGTLPNVGFGASIGANTKGSVYFAVGY
jgi:hypothetical protein